MLRWLALDLDAFTSYYIHIESSQSLIRRLTASGSVPQTTAATWNHSREADATPR